MGRSLRKAAAHLCAVINGILFIGFSVQIVLGGVWLCCNFMQAQDFGEPDSYLYRMLAGGLGEIGGKPGALYLLQLALAFLAGYFFLRTGVGSVGKAFAAWGSLALTAFPFAMQCHLAVLPCSMMGSLFLLMLLSLQRSGGGKIRLRGLASAVVCLALLLMLSGAVDADRRPTGRGFAAAMASRMAWPTLWVDHEAWPEALREIDEETVWKANYYPCNMAMLEEAIEELAGTEGAEAYYRQIARIGWERHASVVIRQIGWDVLGYAVTPLIFPLRLEGRAYDSCTGRNYEIMRGNAPVLTRYYVEYGCWWFGWGLVLTAVRMFLLAVSGKGILPWKRLAVSVGVCGLASVVLIAVLTMRGAGVMDYKYTIAVNELWLAGEILLMNVSPGNRGIPGKGEGRRKLADLSAGSERGGV